MEPSSCRWRNRTSWSWWTTRSAPASKSRTCSPCWRPEWTRHRQGFWPPSERPTRAFFSVVVSFSTINQVPSSSRMLDYQKTIWQPLSVSLRVASVVAWPLLTLFKTFHFFVKIKIINLCWCFDNFAAIRRSSILWSVSVEENKKKTICFCLGNKLLERTSFLLYFFFKYDHNFVWMRLPSRYVG